MAVNLEEVLYGNLEVEFVGSKRTRNIEVVNFVLNGRDGLMFLIAADGTVYNWDNILKIKKLVGR